jgi:hypothetical protein
VPTPVTIPVVVPIVATEGVAAVQLPPDVAEVSVAVFPIQVEVLPVIAAGTVTTETAVLA